MVALIPLRQPAIPNLPIRRITYGQVPGRNVIVESPFTRRIEVVTRPICQHEGSIIFAPMLPRDVGRLKAWIDSLHGSSGVFELEMPKESITGLLAINTGFKYNPQLSYSFASHPQNETIAVYRIANDVTDADFLRRWVALLFDRPVIIRANIGGNIGSSSDETNFIINRRLESDILIVPWDHTDITSGSDIITLYAIVHLHEHVDFEAANTRYTTNIHRMTNKINVRLKNDNYSLSKAPGGYYSQIALEWIEVI